MTEKIYEREPYQKYLMAQILSCEKEKDYYRVILDKTIFYPEGGGQPADIGYLDDIEVFDVQEEDGDIIHYCKEAVLPLECCSCDVDMARRFDFMQNHTGEHILSGLICKQYNCDNIGFHIGKETITMDFNCKMKKEDIEALEWRANEIIWKDLYVIKRVYEKNNPVDCEELKNLKYRSKKELEEDVRIIEIENIDCCACCGLHVVRTGEIGILQILSMKNYKGGSRLEIICGERALKHAIHTKQILQNMTEHFSTSKEKLLDYFVGASQEKIQLAYDVQRLRLKNMELNLRLHEKEMEQNKGYCYFFEGEDMNSKELSRIAEQLFQQISKTVLLFVVEESAELTFVCKGVEEEVSKLFVGMKEEFIYQGGGKKGLLSGRMKANQQDMILFLEKRLFFVSL